MIIGLWDIWLINLFNKERWENIIMNKVFSFVAEVTRVYSTNLQWRRVAVRSNEEFDGSNIPLNYLNKPFLKPIYEADIYGENLPLIEGLRVKFFCEKSISKKNGKVYLNCVSWSYEKPDSIVSIKSFLFATLGKEKLLSHARISKLMDRYGKDIISVFRDGNTNALFPVFCPKGSSKEQVDKMETAIKSIREKFENQDFIAEMSAIGISPVLANRIITQLGITSTEELKKNPYICMNISGVGFKKCDQIAVALNAALDSPERIVACTEATVSAILTRGSNLYLELDLAREETLKQLNNPNITRNMWVKAINDNLHSSKPKFFAHKDKSGKITLMLTIDADNEVKASRKLKALQTDSHAIYDETAINKLANSINENEKDKRGFMLTEEQIAAIVRSLSNKVSIITGGPGTGKTTITQMIIQIWKMLSTDPVTCMAPTGKAATRMSEQTGEKAQTIHKTVRIIPGEENSELERLHRGLIIIDESSMIDQETLTKMITCVPNGSTVIFLGDIDQLPSVGKGDVLNQLIKSGAIAVSRLTATKRQAAGSPIIDNATKINHGDYHLSYDDKNFEFIKGCDSDIEKLKTLYLQKVQQYGIDQVAVLCPLRQPTKAGHKMVSENLNVVIRDAVNPKTSETKFIEAKHGTGKLEFRENDRVMSWKNKDDVANGDIGTITKIAENDFREWEVTIKWENGGESVYSKADMENVSLAYSMSIHKSQGSEYKCVIMPIMIEHSTCKIHSRNLIYTGVTRAKKECIIFGDTTAVKKAVERATVNSRTSYLGERLAASAHAE